jgi:hypothetical protein
MFIFPDRSRRCIPLFLVIIFASSSCTPTEQSTTGSAGTAPVMIGEHGVLYKGIETHEDIVTLDPATKKQKEIAESHDTAGLLYSGKVVTDSDKKMLEPPEVVAGFAGIEYTIAETPPVIDFAIVPVEPMFLGPSPVKTKSDISNEPGPWSNWSQANFDSRTGNFYSSVGDHGKYDAHILLVEYDPEAKKVRCLPEVNKVLGRKILQFSEGKIHGWLDFYQSDHLETPHLWYCTYWCKYPEPDEEDFATGYEGGHIMSYDVLSGDIVDYGVPLKRASWPYHRVDKKRGIMYAVGMFGEFLAWDINRQKTKWAGYLPSGMGWWERAIMIDEDTGMVYTSNRDKESDPMHHFIKYDPYKNRFFKLDCHVPKETMPSNRGSSEYQHMRSQTADRGPDGLFWCVSYSGLLYTFDPDSEEITEKGYNWPGEQRYTCSMARSPGGRYIYYLPGAHGGGYLDGAPVVQYDTETDTKKVIAFLFPYYYEKYGYTPGGTFSIKLDDAGVNLFILFNGAFIRHGEKLGGDTFGQCSVMTVGIPASERTE